MSKKTYNQIEQLLYLAIENEISKEQVQTLNSLLVDHPERIRFAVNYLQVSSFLKRSNKVANLARDEWTDGFDQDLNGIETTGSKVGDSSNVSLRGVDLEGFMADVNQADAGDNEMTCDMFDLLEMERTASAIEIEKSAQVKPERQLIQKVESNFKWFPGEGNKKFMRAYLIMAACIMVFVGYINFTQKPYLPIVAELLDSIDAVWDEDMQMPDEYGQMRQSTYRLEKGYASILFEGGAKITVEAPSKLSLLAGGNMQLFEGRIFAVVPERAVGFTVMAGDSKIVDLGTEFGVEVETNNNIQLHVTKGKTLLFSGLSSGNPAQINVSENEAKKAYNDGFVKDIDVVKKKFIRHIDSNAGVVWNGKFNIGPSSDGLVFSESFESPVVESYVSGSDPETDWVGTTAGHFAFHRGLFNEGNSSVFSTPYGRQAYLLDYTNTGLTTSETAITEVLMAGKTYAITFNVAHTPLIEQVENQETEQVNSPELHPGSGSEYRVELVAFEPGEDRTDLRYDRIEAWAGIILASAIGTVTSNDMAAGDSIVFTTKTGDPNLGKNIAIRLVKINGSVLYDNIKLRVWESKKNKSVSVE